MSRLIVFALIVANLLYFGWSALVDSAPRLTAVAAAAASTAATDTAATAATACTTLGPFASEAGLQPVKEALGKAGWGVLERRDAQQVADGHWVTIDGLEDAAAQARVIDIMKTAGISDAFAMPTDQDHRVSAGIFTDAARAQARAAQLQQLGMAAQVRDRLREVDTLWLDVPGVAPALMDQARLAAMGLAQAQLVARDCP